MSTSTTHGNGKLAKRAPRARKVSPTTTLTPPGKRVPAHGHGLLNTGGTPGNRGGGGHPPDVFRREMRRLACTPAALAYLERCLNGDEGPRAAISAHKHVAAHGYGLPVQAVSVAAQQQLVIVLRDESAPGAGREVGEGVRALSDTRIFSK